MSNLNKENLEYFKDLFLQKQKEIIDSQTSRVEDINIDGGDEVDIVQGNLIKLMMEKLSLRDKETMKKIKDALQRIIDGNFGDCGECGDPIPEKRLFAVPYCTSCVDCAEQQERYARQYRV
jgi:DnaK suppressor protein